MVDSKATGKILTRLNCFQFKLHTAEQITIPQLVFIVIQAGERSFSIRSALR